MMPPPEATIHEIFLGKLSAADEWQQRRCSKPHTLSPKLSILNTERTAQGVVMTTSN